MEGKPPEQLPTETLGLASAAQADAGHCDQADRSKREGARLGDNDHRDDFRELSGLSAVKRPVRRETT